MPKAHPLRCVLYKKEKILFCRYSSVVEHTLGKGGVVSPILTSGTIKTASFMEAFLWFDDS